MEELFLKILNMSITAGWLILAVILLRLLLRKAPKYLCCAMWALVGIRLICPFSFESMLSLIPSAETVPQEIIYSDEPAINSGIYALNSTVNPIISQELAPDIGESANPMQIITLIASALWIIGMAAMLIYSLISYLKIKRNVGASLPVGENIFICDSISSPFILGIFKPKIYLPSDISDERKEYVIAHEKAHLRRRDHWWKPLGFLLLSVYWFNPLIWAAYILLCRDIELACDEKVIKEMDREDIKAYSEALLSCSVSRKMIAACPVAFGENGVKGRIKSVLNYKKPAFWVILIAVIACLAVAVGFMTNPVEKDENTPDGIEVISSNSSLDGLSLEIISSDFSGFAPYIEIEWRNETAVDLMFGDEHHFYREVNGEWQDCNENSSNIFHAIGYMLNSGKTASKKYGIMNQDMSQAGKYRFTSYISERGKSANTEYDVWIEFELKNGSYFPNIHQFKVTDYVYENGSFSYVGPAAENIEPYRLYSGMSLQQFNGYEWRNFGYMEEISLNKDNFDSRLINSQIWHDGLSADKLKRENKRAWQLHTSDYGYDTLYILLEQKNGEFYLCYGYYNTESTLKNNPDSSYIRCIYSLEQTEPTFLDGDNTKRLSFASNTAYAGYTDNSRILARSLNTKKMYVSSVQHLPIYKFDTAEELEEFKNDFSDIFDFSQSGDGQPSFDRTVRYHDFDKDSLFVIYVTAPSTGYSFRVDSVFSTNGEFIAHVVRTVPESGGYAMEGQFITLSISKKDVADCSSFDADLNNMHVDSEMLSISIETAIREKYKESLISGEFQCAAFELLGSERLSESEFNLYLLTCYETYGIKNGELERLGSIGDRAILTVTENTDLTYTPTDYYVPIKGDISDEAQKLNELCDAYQDGQSLGERCLEEARIYFGMAEEVTQNRNTETYIFYDSVDIISPSLVLYPDEKTAMFTYSAFSSFYGYGTYEIMNNQLILKNDENAGNNFVFDIAENCLIFNASESSRIPKYKYGTHAKPQSPVPDGAIFEKTVEIE